MNRDEGVERERSVLQRPNVRVERRILNTPRREEIQRIMDRLNTGVQSYMATITNRRRFNSTDSGIFME